MKIKPLVIATLVSFLVACSSNSVKNMSVELPKNSIGSDRAALANDMISSVGLFIERNLACSNWSLVDVTESKAEGQIVFTSDGQLYRGKVLEKWNLQECGNKLSLSLEITPASQGGSIIRIKSL
tara:strand:+ start:6044 stop:6418 length:375 start_codon:yes stop_codon:yes gene_type:complete